MKKILFIGSILLGIFLIYLSTLDKKVFYLSLGDEMALGYNEFNKKDYGYSDYVKEYLEKKKVLEVYINDYFKENLRTTDLIRMINDNEKVLINGKNKSIKNALIKADLVTLSIGNNDISSKLSLYNNYNEQEIYEYLDEYLLDLDSLFKLIREYCKESIIFIGYYNFLNNPNIDKYIEYLNTKALKLANTYDIKYIDILKMMKDEDYFSGSLYPTKKGYIGIGKKINLVIKNEILNK